MTYSTIKIAGKEYVLREVELSLEISTELGWLSSEQFINYLFSSEKINAIRDLAEIGLDRLISGA